MLIIKNKQKTTDLLKKNIQLNSWFIASKTFKTSLGKLWHMKLKYKNTNFSRKNWVSKIKIMVKKKKKIKYKLEIVWFQNT